MHRRTHIHKKQASLALVNSRLCVRRVAVDEVNKRKRSPRVEGKGGKAANAPFLSALALLIKNIKHID